VMSISVCLPLTLPHSQTSPDFVVCVLPVAAVRSSSGGIAMICNAGLLKKRYFHIMAQPYGTSRVCL